MATEMEVIARIGGDASGAVSAFQQASGAAQAFQGTLTDINKGLVALGAAIGGAGYAITRFAKSAFDEAARVSELDVAMSAIGRSTGVGAMKLREAAAAIKAKGIETAAAQKMAIEYAQGQLNLAQAADVARVAQDLAVISQRNSTETATLLTRAIKTGNSQLLKSAGVSRQASEGFRMYAEQLGKSSNDLTAAERQQAIINLILDEGAKVAGVYEAAMQEAGKVLRSFPRLFNNMKVAIGDALIDGFGPLIMATYDLVKNFDKAISSGGSLNQIVDVLREVLIEITTPMISGIRYLADLIKHFKLAEINITAMKERVMEILPFIAALASYLTTLASKSLLGGIPVIGRFVGALNPMAAALTALIALTPELRDSLLKLVNEARKLVPPLLAIAYALARAGGEFLNEFVIPIANAMIGLLKPAIDAVVKILGLFGGATSDATNVVEGLKTGLVVLTGVYVGLKVVQMAQLAFTKAQIVWDGILTAATFLLIAATNGLTAAFAALGFAMTATGIGAIIVVIGLVIGAMILWYQKSVWFRNAVKIVLQGIINFFITMVNAVIKSLNQVMQISATVTNYLIKIYNKVAGITGLPKIQPVDPMAIPLINKINIGLEETAKKVYGLTGAMARLNAMQVRENKARAESAGWLDVWNKKVDEQYEGMTGAGDAASKLKERIEALKQKTLDYVKNALERAREELQRQKEAMEEYAQSVSKTITGELNMGRAFAEVKQIIKDREDALKEQTKTLEDYANNIERAVSGGLSLTDVLGLQRDAAKELANAKADLVAAEAEFAAVQTPTEELTALEKAELKLAAATRRVADAQQLQTTFMARLGAQAKTAAQFASKIAQLADRGLSQEALAQVVAAGAEAGTAIADELLAGGSQAIEDTNRLFKEIADAGQKTGKVAASKFYTVGEKMGADLMEALKKQSEKAKAFADKVRELVQAGLSKDAIADVLEAGAEAGTEIANYLLAGGQERILEANNIVSALKSVGDELGGMLAETYYRAGVDIAQAVVDGLESKLAEVEAAIKKITTLAEAEALFKKTKAAVDEAAKPLETLKPTTITGDKPTGTNPAAAPSIASVYGNAVQLAPSDFKTPAVVPPALAALFSRDPNAVRPEDAARFGLVRPFATGGIVTGPTLGLIGENGPEAVIPLNRGGIGTTINLTVNAGMGANGKDIGDQIVDALKRYQRRNGAVPITVS